MEILAGKHKGKQASLHQFENDWMMVDIVGGPPARIVKPTEVKLTTPNEFERFASGTTRGQFFKLWTLREDGTFAARRPAEV